MQSFEQVLITLLFCLALLPTPTGCPSGRWLGLFHRHSQLPPTSDTRKTRSPARPITITEPTSPPRRERLFWRLPPVL